MRIDVDDSGIGDAAIGDPGFRAVDEVAVAFQDSFRFERGSIRAGLRFGERVAADFFATGEGNKKFFLLLFRAEAIDGVAKKRILDGESDASGSADAGNFLDDDGVADVVHAGAAIIFGQGDSGQTELGGLTESIAREAAGFVNFLGERFDLRFGEIADAFLQELLLFSEREIQGGSPA